MKATTHSPARNTFSTLATRALATFAFFAAAFGAAAADDVDNLVLFAENAPMPQLVKRGTEMDAAERAAAEVPGSFAVRGDGCSMEPIYLEGTAVVIRVGGFENLRPGMPVVYRDHRGVAVAHMVVSRKDGGWVVAGLNNLGCDTDLVTEDNFVGVITQAFASKTGSLPKAVATRVALDEQIRRGQALATTQG